jgi:hypothetical protein
MVEFKPQIVHDATAFLFWTLAQSIGVDGAHAAVIDSAGQCLMKMPFTSEVLGQYGFPDLPPDVQREFGYAIATEAELFATKNENMNGVIYGEDAQAGRSPSAQHVQTAPLSAIPRRVTVSGAKIERVGWLCLRHPLPAVVFSDARPVGRTLEVADTSAALGFHLPMFLDDVATCQISDVLFASTGIFLIPVPDMIHGDRWGAVIQNSVRSVNGVEFHAAEGKSTVDWVW